MQKREESSAQLNKITDGFGWSSHLEHFSCGVKHCIAMIFQEHFLLVLIYLQYVYHVESTHVYEWACHQQSIVNESTNKMRFVQT
jgi:hypothetical protein